MLTLIFTAQRGALQAVFVGLDWLLWPDLDRDLGGSPPRRCRASLATRSG